jgi:oxygen-independent coproporphyrinogen-3 oxidase
MAETIDHNLEIGETMMMGLRLLDEGVEHERFRTRFGMDLRRQFSAELEELEELGLIAVDAERVRLSECGRLLGNRVFAQFLPDT